MELKRERKHIQWCSGKPQAGGPFDPYLEAGVGICSANVKFASLSSVTLQFCIAALEISVLNMVEKKT